MAKTEKFVGEAAGRQASVWIEEWSQGLANELAPYEPLHTFEVAFRALRCAEELINLPTELQDKELLQRILAIPLGDPIALVRALPGLVEDLERQFEAPVATRLASTLRQLWAVGGVFAGKGFPAALALRTVTGARSHLMSRRRILLAVLHTIPRACRGTKRMPETEALGRLLELVENPGMGIINMHRNVMLSQVFPDFELVVDEGRLGVLANRDFPSLNSMFLDPERVAITEMPTDKIDRAALAMVSRRVMFSAAELGNDLKTIAAAYSEFDLQDTSYGALAAFIERLLGEVSDNYFVRLTCARLDELCDELGLPASIRTSLLVDSSDFVKNTCTHSPFTKVGDSVQTSVPLLSRFAYNWKNVCLNRVRRYQIRSGFIFEGSLKAALASQGFDVTDIKRVDRAEFDVVAVLDDVVYNLQCKNNLVDLDRVETDVKKFVRYNRYLDRMYASALAKERAREQLLLSKLGLSEIKHFVISRFPVATANPHVISFGQIHRFRAIAEAA